MKTLDEVKEYFKNAKEVKDHAGDVGYVEIDKFEVLYNGSVVQNPLKNNWIVLWDFEKGFAKIISKKEEEFKITKKTILKYKMKEEFPEFFEEDLEVGKWYKRPENKALFKILSKPDKDNFNIFQCEGFNCFGEWMENKNGSFGCVEGTEIEVTSQEVEEALKKEAVKRYGANFCYPLNAHIMEGYEGGLYSLDLNKTKLDSDEALWAGYGKRWNAIIFENGIWAEIVHPMTQEEIEKELGRKIFIKR